MKTGLSKFAAAFGLTAAGVIGNGATTVDGAAGTVIAGTQIAEPHICTNGPVIGGLLFTAAHCVSGNGWTEDATDVAFKPAPGFDDGIYTPSGTVPVRGHVQPVVGMTVFKSGRTSGLTSGVVYNVSDGMWDAQGMQQCSGDSGAPVFTLIDGDAYIVGIATNGDGSVDEAGRVNHDKRCYNTSRPWDQYGAGGPTIETMLAVASSRAPALPAQTQPPTTKPPAPVTTAPPPPPTTAPPTTAPAPPPTTEPPTTEPPATEPPRVRKCRGLPATVVGTNGDDHIDGTAGDDVIVALGGNDTVDGRGGNDVICGGDGDDLLRGQSGADIIAGGRGNDEILGGGGDDETRGGPGDDIIWGHLGDDTATGDQGDDRIEGGVGDDRLYGGSGDDTIYARTGDDLARGGVGDDIILLHGPNTRCRTAVITICRR